EISDRFASLENLDTEVDVNKTWESIRENIKMSAKESLGYYELKKYKPWFDEGCSKLLDQRKQAKLQWLQDPSKLNGDNLNNIRRETSRHFKNKKREYLKDRIDELATNIKNKNIRDLYREINDFKRAYQPRVSDVRQTEIRTAEPLIPDPSPFEVESAIAKLKQYKSTGSDQIPAEFIQAGEYAIRKVQGNQVGLKLNGTHQLLAYADDVTLLGDNADTMKKNTQTLIDASKEILFIAGLACVIGLERTFRFFFQKHKVKASVAFFGGMFVVLMGWPLFGMLLETYGFVLLFSGFFPVAINFLRRVPVLGTVLNLPGIRRVSFNNEYFVS
ncbi:Vesicle transport protein GOT1B, partial [Cryptotermes secundus]